MSPDPPVTHTTFPSPIVISESVSPEKTDREELDQRVSVKNWKI